MTVDMERITRTLADQADALDAEATSLRGQATQVVDRAQRLADEQLQRAQQIATNMMAEANIEAQDLAGQADAVKESAERVRGIAAGLAPAPALALAALTLPDVTPWQALVGHWVKVSLSDGNTLFGTLAAVDEFLTLTHGDNNPPVRPPAGLVERIELAEQATSAAPAAAAGPSKAKGARS